MSSWVRSRQRACGKLCPDAHVLITTGLYFSGGSVGDYVRLPGYYAARRGSVSISRVRVAVDAAIRRSVPERSAGRWPAATQRLLSHQMQVYLDTNVYKFIAERGEATQVRQFFDSADHSVEASSTNLYELYPNPDEKTRKNEVRTLTTVATNFRAFPDGYEIAQEFLSELRRCRPELLRKQPNTRSIELHLRAYRRNCRNAKPFPGMRPDTYDGYRERFEGGIKGVLSRQRFWRDTFVNMPGARRTVVVSNPDVEQAVKAMTEIDLWWRQSSRQAWIGALVERDPASRDLYDWASPHLWIPYITIRDADRFWYIDIESERMPIHQAMMFTDYYQRCHRITHGNAYDQLHAAHLLNADVFLTADKAFYNVLHEVSAQLPGSATPVLVERGADSAAEEICRAVLVGITERQRSSAPERPNTDGASSP